EHIEQIVALGDEDGVVVQQLAYSTRDVTERSHMREHVSRGDNFRFAVFSRDLLRQRLGEKALDSLDTVLLSCDFRDVGRVDAQRSHAKPLEAAEKRSIVRPDIETESLLGNSKLGDDVLRKRPLIDFKFLGNTAAIGVLRMIDDVSVDDIIELSETRFRTNV